MKCGKQQRINLKNNKYADLDSEEQKSHEFVPNRLQSHLVGLRARAAIKLFAQISRSHDLKLHLGPL
jgi:hypothetical protein